MDQCILLFRLVPCALFPGQSPAEYDEVVVRQLLRPRRRRLSPLDEYFLHLLHIIQSLQVVPHHLPPRREGKVYKGPERLLCRSSRVGPIIRPAQREVKKRGVHVRGG